MECEKSSAKLILLLEKFLNSPIKENLTPIKYEIEKIPSSENKTPSLFEQQKYHSYIYQLSFQLTKLNERHNELKVELVNCINSLILRTRINDINMMKTLITIVLTQIHNLEKSVMIPNISEELKQAVIVCITNIFIYADSHILELFYVQDMCIILGKISVTCVNILINEKYRNLKLSTIDCIMAIFYVHNNADFDDIVLRSQVADTMFLFLPKIASTLVKIIIGDSKQGEKLISSAIRSLGRILVILFEDDLNEIHKKVSYETNDFLNLVKQLNLSEENSKSENLNDGKSPRNNFKELFIAQQIQGRNNEWRNKMKDKLKLILRSMGLLRANLSKQIRYEYAKFCISIVQRCPNNFTKNLKMLVESIIALSMDCEASIRDMCAKCISKIHKHSENANLYQENIEQLFEEHLTGFPRTIYRAEDSEQIAELLFLKGFFNILTDHEMKRIFMYPGNLEKFCLCLISAFDLVLHSNLLTEEYALRKINQTSEDNYNFNWRVFKHIHSEKAAELLKEICIILGKTNAALLIYDFLMELMGKSNNFSNEITLILVFLICGDNNFRQNHKIAVILLEEILNEKHWHLKLIAEDQINFDNNKSTHWFKDRTPGLYESAIEIRTTDAISDDEDEDSINILDVKLNVLHTCIVLEALGNLALYLGKDFHSYAFSSLYRVLLKTGSSNYCIHLSGAFSLNCIKNALNFNETSEIIYFYADYITYHINYLMKRTNESQSAIDIFSVILRFSTMESLPHLENIIYTLLNECTKSTQNENITSFLKVFDIFLINIGKWSTEILKELNISSETKININIDKCNKWKEAINEKSDFPMENGINGPQNEEKCTDQSDNDDENDGNDKVEISRHIKIVIDILNEVLKFIPSKIQMQRILALECLISGIPQLKYQENELLPLVHAIWYPLTERFKDNDFVVLNRAFTLLEVLAHNAKDFILRRSLNDVIPILNKFLKQSSKHSECAKSLTPTQELKLQMVLLKGYASLIQNLNIQTKYLDEICTIIRVYLNKNQPEILQQSAVTFFKDISFYNRPLMYICLLEYLNINDFQKNVNIIFDYIKKNSFKC